MFEEEAPSAIDNDWRRWLGFPFPQTYLIERDAREKSTRQRRWPGTRRAAKIPHWFVYSPMFSKFTRAIQKEPIESIQYSARRGLNLNSMEYSSRLSDGFVLPLESLAFLPIEKGWLCPVTRRILDVTLKGVTPNLPKTPTPETTDCEEIEIPIFIPHSPG